MIVITILRDGLLLFFQIYFYIIFGRIILSFFRGDIFRTPVGAGIFRFFYGLTEPLLAPIRRLVPMIRMGAGYLDLSTMILLFILYFAQRLVYIYL
ncbi:MAG: YggT family protein [Firmicutes bacterium]|nr:YggT family protein [Bacillota bacterium]